MNIIVVATKNCNHRPILEKHLQEMGIPYSVQFVEDHPEWIKKWQIHHSPNLVINGEVVFRASPERSLPEGTELKQWFLK